jgi:hypothetical protein
MRSKRTMTVFLLILLTATAVTSITRIHSLGKQSSNSASIGQSHQPIRKKISSIKTKQQWDELLNQLPVADYDAPSPDEPEKQVKRRNINSHFDRQGFVVKTPDPAVTLTEAFYEGRERWAIPAAESDAIVVGKVQRAQAYLSNDKSGVYTEFIIVVDEVLKTDGLTQILPRSNIVASRAGGVVRYSDGNRRLYLIAGEDLPSVGEQHLLFLKSLGPDQGFNILTTYQLTANDVNPLDDGRQFESFKGQEREAFLKSVRSEINSPTRPTPNK